MKGPQNWELKEKKKKKKEKEKKKRKETRKEERKGMQFGSFVKTKSI